MMTPLAGWQNFYVIVGSSAGALIGLQFVVMTLVAQLPIRQGDQGQAGATAFATPNIVHFGAVLLLAGIQSAPWSGLRAIAVIWALLGISGVAYVIFVTRVMRAQDVY
ncbi:MAG: hypothetical protein JOZ43_07015, partial [Acidobacteriales bacterium]|nr:hypothetical protein [Terriglobales bacterium]